MQAKINEKILCIPPYISTTWSHIAALRMKGNLLSVTLNDGETISIANLSQEEISLIFSFHATFLEKETLPLSKSHQPTSPHCVIKELFNSATDSTPTLSFAFGSIDGFNTLIQHDQAQADAPDLPFEVLSKISEAARTIFYLDDIQLPRAEPHCNCFHCQIARVINPVNRSNIEISEHKPLENIEDEVLEEELFFEQWTISQAGENLYHVTNRLDEHEKYHVYLGHPVGCTCGNANCEHILAVLKS